MQGKRFFHVVFTMVLAAIVSGCGSDGPETFGETTFAVISDAHLYDSRLGTSGSAWEAYLLSDRKLLAESEAILASVVDDLLASDLEFVVVPGDLTKDGERVSHELFAVYMQKLIDAGTTVLVAPGNHDVNNPHAYAYEGDTKSSVEGVSPAAFKRIYGNMGYADAISEDSNSLSYVSEPVPGLWVFSMDSCHYENNALEDSPATGGGFSAETMDWILEELARAKKRNKTVLGFMHHGILEHFTGQSMVPGLGDEYVIEDYEEISEKLAGGGMNLVFTGHYHAQDVVKKSFGNGSFLFDVETGSLVTYPCPYRTVTLSAQGQVKIASDFITEIDFDTGDESFSEYALGYLETGLGLLAPQYLTGVFGIPEETATEMTPIIVDAFVSHYSGDESPSAEDLAEVQRYAMDENNVVALVGSLLGSVFTDLDPVDTYLTIDLRSGEVTE